MEKLYISGKITGIEDKAPALFKHAESVIIGAGHNPVNPMTLKHEHGKTWLEYMRGDLRALLDCDGVYMLTNWEQSRGAKIEHDLAVALGLIIHYQR